MDFEPTSTSPISSVGFTLHQFSLALSTGLVTGILVVLYGISFAAMIFAGDLSIFLSRGIGILLLGGFVICLIVSLTSTFPGAIAQPQDTSVAILAVAAAAISDEMSQLPAERVFATVVAAMMFSSIFTGLLFWVMGQFNLGRLVRFMPYPVIGGFLAGVGWLMIVGSINMMTALPFGPKIFEFSSLMRWIPGLLFAIILLLMTRRFFHFLLIPALLLAGVGLFYLAYFLLNGTVESASTSGWLLGPFPAGGLSQPLAGFSLTTVEWTALLENIVGLSTVFTVGCIAFLLNASGLEIAARTNIDLNRELKAVGLANVLAGTMGSPVGFHSLSLSTLGHRLGTHTRLLGLFSATVVGVTFFLGADPLAVFPKVIAGGLLMYLGLAFLMEWIVDAWSVLPKLDYALIWLILITIATVGLLEGVVVGIIVAVILFAITYTNTNVVRHTLTRENYQSYVMRTPAYEQLLLREGNSLAILELQGFIFFGTAHKLVEQISTRIETRTLPTLQYLLLDFRLVTGVDSSASLSFSRLKQIVDQAGISLVLTNVAAEIKAQLRDGILSTGGLRSTRLFPDLDQGVAWIDEQIISSFAGDELDDLPKTLLQYLDETLAPAADKSSLLVKSTQSFAEAESNQKPQSPQLKRILNYMTLQETDTGEILLSEGEPVHNVFFIEQGKIAVQTARDDGEVQQLRTQEAGTVFGEIGIYLGQMATATVVATEPSLFYSLSAANLARMESQDPELAIAIHRLIASTLGRKLTQANYTIIALQN